MQFVAFLRKTWMLWILLYLFCLGLASLEGSHANRQHTIKQAATSLPQSEDVITVSDPQPTGKAGEADSLKEN